MSAADKRRVFRQLHESGCFVIPNPWDLGSARMLEGLGFKALATTSSGFAWSRARPDNGITLDMALAHLAEMVEGTSVPINADFEGGFAADADVYELGPSIDFRKTRLAFSGTEVRTPR